MDCRCCPILQQAAPARCRDPTDAASCGRTARLPGHGPHTLTSAGRLARVGQVAHAEHEAEAAPSAAVPSLPPAVAAMAPATLQSFVARLQSAAGNRATARMLARQGRVLARELSWHQQRIQWVKAALKSDPMAIDGA